MTPIKPKIFSCPGCSLRVSGSERACPRCGKSFGPDVKLECPFCGTLVLSSSDSCPSCQIDYLNFAERAEEQLLEKALERIVKEIDILKMGMESEDEAVLTAEERLPELIDAEETPEAICPVCERPVKISDETCPDCGAEFEMGALADSLQQDEQAFCPVCGKDVGLEVAECPFCGAEFEAEEGFRPEVLAPEPVKVFKKPRIVPRPGPTRGRIGLVTTPFEAKARGGRGLSNGAGMANGFGAINGRSQTNGVHFVNGKGAVNGRDLINGTGILNGSGTRRPFPLGNGKKSTFYLRWQLVAALIAIAIMIPGIIHLASIEDEGPYSIDGDFGDWENNAMFTAMELSVNRSIAITGWSIDDHENRVYLYVRTAEYLMASPNAERLVLFIDYDDSNESGYMVGGIGADFIIEISGWNGTIQSSLLMEFRSIEDHFDWTQWSIARHVKCVLSQNQLEAMAELPSLPAESAKFILTSQNELGMTCITHPIATDGGLLVVEQQPSPDVSTSQILQKGVSVSFVRLRFTCQGEGGVVESVIPTMEGPTSFEPIGSFTIEVGEVHTVDLRVDSSILPSGTFVSASICKDGVTSSFNHLEIVGDPTRAHVTAPPQNITIDGAFADWRNRTVTDMDEIPICNPNIDINEIGASSTEDNSYFFVSVQGTLCAGVYVPKACAVPTHTGSGTVVPARQTAEDFLKIYIDSDKSNATGRTTVAGTLTIGADHMIEVRGLCCKIVSIDAYHYIAGTWVLTPVSVDAAKDASRVEIGILADSIGNPESVDFIVEMTDWRREIDFASNRTTSIWTRAWAVDSSGTSQYATSLSYQRKLLYDGSSFWSFYFDGTDTVCEYSDDGGETWTSRGSVFETSGVREVSIWYDSENSVVYAVGDTASSSTYVYVQKGSVNSGMCTITWAASDSTPTVSTEAASGKNSYICRDTSGYIWILCTDVTRTSPQFKYQLGSWQSNSVNDITAWTSRGALLPSAQTQDSDVCGSIVPAGSGSDVWAIFAYEGKVFSKKRESGAWESSEQAIYSESGSQDENTVNSPPSVVVGGNQVVHVVYGDMSEDGGLSKPAVWYAHNNTGSTNWVASFDLDSTKPSNVGNKYPTISIDASTGTLYAFWMRTDTSSVPQTVMGKTKEKGGSWTSLSFGTQSSFTKHYLTSIYTASSESIVCWLWTQNTTGTIEVFFDVIPEFEELVAPVLTVLAVFIAFRCRRRSRTHDDEVSNPRL